MMDELGNPLTQGDGATALQEAPQDGNEPQNPPGPSASPPLSLADNINDMQNPFPSSDPPAAAAAAAAGSNDTDGMTVCTKNAGEVTIGERLQLVDEFERRKSSGESISMPQFEREKGIPPGRFKQWYYAIKKQREAGVQTADHTKKRNRQPKYQPIEDEMRQWMATHDDPTSLPTGNIRTKAIEIASRLGVTGFLASDNWIKNFRRRYKQNPFPSSDTPAAAAAAGNNDTDGMKPLAAAAAAAAAAVTTLSPPPIDTDGMTRDQHFDAFPQEGIHALPGYDTSDGTQAALQLTNHSREGGQSVSAAAAASSHPPIHQLYPYPLPLPLIHQPELHISAAAAAGRPAPPMHPPYPHPLPIPLSYQSATPDLSSQPAPPSPLATQQLETELQQWITGYPQPRIILHTAIKSKSTEIANRVGVRGFSASDTWIAAFKNRCPQDFWLLDPSRPPPNRPRCLPGVVASDDIRSLGGEQSVPAQTFAATAVEHPADSSRKGDRGRERGSCHDSTKNECGGLERAFPGGAYRPTTMQPNDRLGQVVDEAAAVRMADGFIGRRPNDRVSHQRPRADAHRPLHRQSQYSRRNTMSAREEASVSASPIHPPHPHPPARPLTLSGHISSYLDIRAGDDIRVAHQLIGSTIDLSRQTTTCPPDDDPAAGNRPLDQRSQHSGPNTMSIVPSESRLTNERPPNKIHRSDTRSHRQGLPSVVWSRSSVKSAVTVTADDRLSDIPEDDDGIVSASDGAVEDITALSTRRTTEPRRRSWLSLVASYILGIFTSLSSRSTTDEDNQSPDPQVVVGSGLSSTECASLHSTLAPGMWDECKFTLLYRASRDGAGYGDLLRCVGNTKGLVFLIRKDKYVFGVYTSAGIQLPDDPRSFSSAYMCDVWRFSLAGHFETPTRMGGGRGVHVAGPEGTVGGAKLEIDELYFGVRSGNMRSCCHRIPRSHVPDGYVGVRNEYGWAVFGGSEFFMADEVEVIRLSGRSLLSLKVIEGANFDALQSAALYRFLGPTTAGRLKLIYSASRDGPSYGDLLRCVGHARGLVFVIREDKYAFGTFISTGIRVPDDPRGKTKYECDVWHFSLAGHFDKPTKIEGGKGFVCVAGREGSVNGPMLWISLGFIPCLELGSEGGSWVIAQRKAKLQPWLQPRDVDMRSCRQVITGVPEGYVGVRNWDDNAVFGCNEYFMANEMEVLTVV
ncbi:unnamed protein product [Vitrella brassicaformis CCMP3155]|uniref:HTH CENPB-type domain-containing protein n=2 Tax=Vitrella brassicaformis TaxID=1169539 RepID=A0A0G4GZZ2_VITBC|nr:unnamed protein product [Vitrella brassicaformis CCMP3155]|eukprot:CEM36858.1 unnamed protein product [Vitrella brassicaformis CCMP3155]